MIPDKILEKMTVGGPDECWPWLAKVGEWGHPTSWAGGRGKSSSVRRNVWEAVHGVELTRDDWVTVTCDNLRCLNPAHLALRSLRLHDQFWSRVDKNGPNGCWVWTGATYRFGYGRFHHRCKMQRTHRLSWEIHNGPIPEGMLVLHRCDNPPCVNPEHLFIGTDADNMRDMWAKGRGSKGPKHAAARRAGRERTMMTQSRETPCASASSEEK